jgi:hypothetical protein
MGGMGLVSTMQDYLQFTLCILNGGLAPNGTRLLSRKTVIALVLNTHMTLALLPLYWIHLLPLF